MSDGYPNRYVDRLALRKLLFEKRFAELTVALTAAQDAFETDPFLEYWASDSSDAVGTGEVGLLPLLDAWVAASPNSFAPYVARGTHRIQRAGTLRGNKPLKDTPESALSAMKREVARGQVDLAKALSSRPASIAARRQQVRANKLTKVDSAEVIAKALEACPECFQFRVAVLMTLGPAWGGSFEAMEEFLAKSCQGKNPRLALLPGYVYFERAYAANNGLNKRQWVSKAMALGEHAGFYFRSGLLHIVSQPWTAAAALERAWELRPLEPETARYRVEAAGRQRLWEKAAANWLVAHQLDPQGVEVDGPSIAGGLAVIAETRMHEENPQEALRLYELALELSPKDATLKRARDGLLPKSKKDAGPR